MAVTQQPVELIATEWRLITSAASQMVQVQAGNVAIIFAPNQPVIDPDTELMAKKFYTRDVFTNSDGGTMWGKAYSATRPNTTTMRAIVLSLIHI